MKPANLLLFLFLMSSCVPEYKQLDGDNKPVAHQKITLPGCTIEFIVTTWVAGDRADYHVAAEISPVKDVQLKASAIKLEVSAYKTGKVYRQGEIKFLRLSNPNENFIPWEPGKQPPISDTQILNLTKGNRYSLVYSFWGRRHRALKVNATVNINGETVGKTIVFKRFTQVELLH